MTEKDLYDSASDVASDDEMDGFTNAGGKKALLMRAIAAEMAENEDASDAEEGDEDEEDMEVDGEEEDAEASGDDDEEEEEDARTITQRVKQRVLVCSSRGTNQRQRHLMTDLIALLPHSKKENKLDQKKNLSTLNEVAELTNCNKVMYLESRRGTDLYMWLSHAPNGPSVKFEVLNVHTMDELNMTGNHLKGSRPILSFDASFDAAPHTLVIKELLKQTFNVPRANRRSKPFFDHVLMFAWADGKVWVRNFQLTESSPAGTLFKPNSNATDVALNEVGPRFVLNPIKLFQGSFGGLGLWENSDYLTPAAVRRAQRAEAQDKYASKEAKKVTKVEKAKTVQLPSDPLAAVFK
ncbi:Ribosome biogenesis protein brx1 [Blastocladiella emersonii ATCC 22665]|nr:Ribosome biogenesis protein brx1 [Blastocladiella emersonii ATCC 22665]